MGPVFPDLDRALLGAWSPFPETMESGVKTSMGPLFLFVLPSLTNSPTGIQTGYLADCAPSCYRLNCMAARRTFAKFSPCFWFSTMILWSPWWNLFTILTLYLPSAMSTVTLIPSWTSSLAHLKPCATLNRGLKQWCSRLQFTSHLYWSPNR